MPDFIADLTRIGRMVKRAARGDGESLLGEILEEAKNRPKAEYQKCAETPKCIYERNHSGRCCIEIESEESK